MQDKNLKDVTIGSTVLLEARVTHLFPATATTPALLNIVFAHDLFNHLGQVNPSSVAVVFDSSLPPALEGLNGEVPSGSFERDFDFHKTQPNDRVWQEERKETDPIQPPSIATETPVVIPPVDSFVDTQNQQTIPNTSNLQNHEQLNIINSGLSDLGSGSNLQKETLQEKMDRLKRENQSAN